MVLFLTRFLHNRHPSSLDPFLSSCPMLLVAERDRLFISCNHFPHGRKFESPRWSLEVVELYNSLSDSANCKL